MEKTVTMTIGLSQVDRSLKGFLADMISKITRKFDDEIVSIALFGSAATKEWIKGKSDIDFIIVTRHKDAKKEVEEYVNMILQELDRKHGLHLVQTCSVFVKRDNPILNFLYRIEGALMFGKPFYVFSLDQIAFSRGTISDSRIRLVTMIFDPLDIFLAKMKQTGVTIYGKDLLEQIHFSTSTINKIRVATAPLWLVVMSLLSFPVDESFAIRHAIKATVWACEDVLFALGFPLSTARQESRQIEAIFRTGKVNLGHLRRTIILKSASIEEMGISKSFVAKYMLSTIAFIFALYYDTSRIAHRSTKFD